MTDDTSAVASAAVRAGDAVASVLGFMEGSGGSLTPAGLAETVVRLETAIEALPDTAEGIALFLAHRGIRGEQCHAGSDPLEIFLSRCVGRTVWTGPVATLVDSPTWHIRMNTPSVMAEFMRGFDSDEWPYLVLPGDVPLSVVEDARKAFQTYTPGAVGTRSE